MALIEGVGDEVTLLFGTLLLLAVMLLAWISTRTAEPPEHLFTTGPVPSASASHAHTDTLVPPASAETEASPTEAAEESGEADGGDGGERNMVLRLKFLNDTETTAQVKPQDTIGYIKRTYFSGREQQVRLIYQGQLLQDDGQTLASLNLAHNCVLHCHISAAVGAGGRGAAGGAAARRPGAGGAERGQPHGAGTGSHAVRAVVLPDPVPPVLHGAGHRLAGRSHHLPQPRRLRSLPPLAVL